MGFTAHPGAEFNVIGSFNDFFAAQVTAKGVPAWMAGGQSATVVFDWPQDPLLLPSWSVTHLGGDTTEVAQGRNLDPGWKGAKRVGLADISCWLSFNGVQPSGQAYLRQMRDMAARVFATGAAIAILDVYGSTTSPTGNGTIIRAEPGRDVPVGRDLNPDVLRARLLVPYSWLERASAA